MAKIVPTAQFRPGKCVLSEETQGPFIDTERSVPRYGRVYISLKWLRRPLYDLGYRSENDVKNLVDERNKLSDEAEKLREVSADYQQLIEVVSQYLPEPEPVIRERTVTEARKPTEEEIADWIEKNGGDHPVVRRAKAPEKGSTEEWMKLYGVAGPTPPPRPTTVAEEEESEAESQAEGPSQFVELFDQEVDLDKVLAENVSDVIAFSEGKPDNFTTALVRREFHLAELKERNVRKGVLEPLGYWDEEEDEALAPPDEGEEDSLDLTDEEEE